MSKIVDNLLDKFDQFRRKVMSDTETTNDIQKESAGSGEIQGEIMYIIVIGGGRVGYYLLKGLLNEGHEVLVLEKNKVGLRMPKFRYRNTFADSDDNEY